MVERIVTPKRTNSPDFNKAPSAHRGRPQRSPAVVEDECHPHNRHNVPLSPLLSSPLTLTLATRCGCGCGCGLAAWLHAHVGRLTKASLPSFTSLFLELSF